MKQRPLISLGSIVVVALVLVLWTAALQLPTPTQSEPLRVAVGMWAGAEPWILAREAGELDARKINLVEMNWTSAAMRAVGNRVVDAAVLSLDEVIRQIHQGYPLKIVMITDISRGADLLMARPGINSVEELRGGRIGYEPRTSGSWLLSKALKNSNLKLSDVQPVPLNPAEVEEIFGQLSLDGVVVAEPWKERMRSLNLNNVYDTSRPGSSIVRVLAVHPDAIIEYREVLIALMTAHFKWVPELVEGGVEVDPVLRREGISAEVFANIISRLEWVDVEENRKLLGHKDAWLGDFFLNLQKGLVEDAISGGRLEPSEVFDSSLLEELP
ncbi:NitT/TauT family transport system substrate-binding protein [Prosthecobacter fusiformis]|uniref:NitT/TauT family transport system substrate-binding protein n=1 Tax=Prosthecobacter fusiformis TaxID=48464 RepID=A0A4R7S347_9BACT|nr:ABC transporter substrate-binding protein [Prosthecobacter fusiformis]TDU71457.1 NitT/TauT family transport system substrate-binding protein [Prosthecobacter fusiformis]